MIVFLTGSTGYLGRSLTNQLLANSEIEQIRCLISNREIAPKVMDHSRVRWEFGRLPDVDLNLSGVDVVIHTAALRPPTGETEEIIHSNLQGTRCIVAASQKGGVKKFINCSSQAAERKIPLPGDPEENLESLNSEMAYAFSKLAAEKVVLSLKSAAIVNIRFTRLYGVGPMMRWTELPHLLSRNAVSGVPLQVDKSSNHTIDFLHIKDAVEVIVKLLFTTFQESVCLKIGSGITTSIPMLAKIVGATAQELGYAVPRLEFSYAKTPERPSICLDSSETFNKLEWKPGVSLPEGIKEILIAAALLDQNGRNFTTDDSSDFNCKM